MKVTRRSFLRAIGVGAATAAIPFKLKAESEFITQSFEPLKDWNATYFQPKNPNNSAICGDIWIDCSSESSTMWHFSGSKWIEIKEK